ncbi:MAG TPA: DnaA regulatory inactivator Hda [Crenotrichaceae bacterium]|nr:DnaA regulatory inactivator Hda [Crenotrichaceae bacterium]
MSQQALDLKSRRGYSFSDYLADSNLQTVELLKTFITATSHLSVFLWGNSGLGKTHLLNAACQLAAEQGLVAHYIPLKQWKTQSPIILRGLEQADLLCIDDVDQVTGSKEWEIPLFHLFNDMMERSHQLLFSANNTPDAIKIQLPDLQSRLTVGLTLHLKDHDDQSKQKILQFRARQMGMNLPDAVSQYLLRRYHRDLPALWEMLDRLDQETLAKHRQLTLPFVKQILE